MKDYTKRPNVIKFFPWWRDKFLSGKEEAIRRLEQDENIRFLSRKDRLGMLQMIRTLP